MELRAAIFFLFLYYIRPQDWVGGMAGFNIIRPMILIWGWALFASRQRSGVSGILKTPHDWILLAYWAWVVWTAPDAQAALTGFLPLVVFYAFTVHTLVTWERVLTYLKAWNYMLLGVALLAVASLFGLDFTGAVDATAMMEGRLCIGTWMHNNPNALGHSVAVIVPLSYLLYFWRGGPLGRFVVFPLQSALALYCTYQTQSKGAFLVAAFLLLMIFFIGRPPLVKIFVIVLALTLGVSALSFLPRMSSMGSLRSDEGVQGRLMAWELAKTAMERSPAGWKQFVAYINWLGIAEKKATHASYVQVGADLGMTGLFIYLMALWAAFRSTLQAYRLTRENDEQERCRRATMILIVAYAVSGWMINREYHTEYFLLIAVAAAIHRLQQSQEQPAEEGNPRELPSLGGLTPLRLPAAVLTLPGLQPAMTPLLAVASHSAPLRSHRSPPQAEARREVAGLEAETVALWRQAWNRIDFLDCTMAALLTWSVLYIWEYILKNL